MSKNTRKVILSILFAVLSKGASVHNNINVENDLLFNEANVATALYSNDIKAASLHTEAIIASKLNTGSLYIEKISNSAGENVLFEGNLQVQGSISWDQSTETHEAQTIQENGVSFLSTNTLILDGVKQWTLIAHDNANKNNQNFVKLPEHESLMVEAKVLLNTKLWKGEALTAKLDNNFAWLQHYDFESVFENEMEELESVNLSFVSQHNSNSTTVEISSTHPISQENNTFIVKDIKLYIR